MIKNVLIESCEKLLRYSLLAVLILAALAFSFVFLINWEDWFFGVKLNGLPAGMYLLIKALVALILAILLIRAQKNRVTVTLLSIAFFGFLFFDSAITIQKNTAGRESFSILFLLFLLISVLYFLAHLIMVRIYSRHGPEIVASGQDLAGSSVREERKTPLKPVIIVAGGIFALLIGVFILMPVTLSLLAPYVPFMIEPGTPPAQDTVITKINHQGTMEWQTELAGYSLDLVRVTNLPGCGYLIYGTFWLPGKQGPVSRAVNLDCKGTRIWDYSHSLERGVQMPGTIQSVDPLGEGYIITLDSGKVIRLDRLGNLQNATAENRGEPLSVERTAGIPVGYYQSALPASTVSLRIWADEKEGPLVSIEDTLRHKDIQSVYSVNPTLDGGYLVFVSTRM